MSNYKGQLEGFPSEVVEKMLERQVEQGNKRDVEVFEKNKSAGFRWYATAEGADFWREVIGKRNFNLFFSRYPKKDKFTPISEETGKKIAEAMEKLREIQQNIAMNIKKADELLNFTSNSNMGELTFSSKWQPKEGDVVVNKNNVVGIYKNPRGSVFGFYAALYENKFYTNMNAFNEEIRPATREERCTFFSRLVNEGYKWNAKKLKLTKRVPKDGDFLYTPANGVVIYKSGAPAIITYCGINFFGDLDTNTGIGFGYIDGCRKATDSERQRLLDALRKEGKRWNAEKKRVEDIEFKVGDCVIGRDDCYPKSAKFVERIDVDSNYPGNSICKYDTLSDGCSFKYLRRATESEKAETVSDLYKQGKVWNKKLNRIEDIKPKVVEMTMEQVCEKLGVNLKIVKK